MMMMCRDIDQLGVAPTSRILLSDAETLELLLC
jgi:hypothetical protein